MKIETNVNTVTALIGDDLHISTHQLSADLNISQMTPHISTHQLLADLPISQMTIARIMKQLGMPKVLSTWVPNFLNEEQIRKRVEVCGE